MMNSILNFFRPVSATDNKALLTNIHNQGVLIMASLAELQNALTTLNATITSEQAEVLSAINALKTQLSNGTNVTTADLDAILAQINSANTAVQGIFTPA